ncbi:MAG: M24 family metallopeptidase [Candidatus Glassbacteria bacterium]|nr:M24 family metallopeptidase [Candidatus Glassbacteria bacterium]
MSLRLWPVLIAFCSWHVFTPGRSAAEIIPATGRDLISPQIYTSMQNWMLDKRFDGWLFTGHGRFGDIEEELLGLRGETNHRWFIFYGGMSTLRKPFLIYHPDDEHLFEGVAFYPTTYRSYDEMKQALADRVFTVARDIALNYSPRLEVSEVSQVDLGTVELLKEIGLKFRPSGSLLSFYHTRWTVDEVESHKYAAARLDSILPVALERLRDRISRGKRITDYDLARHISRNLDDLDLEEVEPVMVAVGAHTLRESHVPSKSKKERVEIGRDSVVYLEVAARRKDHEEAMFARLGWTVVVADSVPGGMKQSWNRITAAADTALALVARRIKGGKSLTGREVDEAARPLLGRDPHVLPRPLGYNLNRRGRNFGVRFDSYLFLDNREIMPGLGFTLEPGIYTKYYALRLCTNLFLEGDREVTLSAPLQRKLIPALADPALLIEAFLPPLD